MIDSFLDNVDNVTKEKPHHLVEELFRGVIETSLSPLPGFKIMVGLTFVNEFLSLHNLVRHHLAIQWSAVTFLKHWVLIEDFTGR